MSKLVSFVKSFYEKPEYQCLILGVGGAGKTTALYRMVLGTVVQTIPTIGFNFEEVRLGKDVIHFWDVGGCDKIRPLIRHYMSPGHCILFLVDIHFCVSNEENLDYTLDELVYQIREASTSGMLFCGIALVKHDLLPTSLNEASLHDRVSHVISSLRRSMESVFPSGFRTRFDIYSNEEQGGISAITGQGFENGWLVKEMLNGIKRASNHKRGATGKSKDGLLGGARTGSEIPITPPPQQHATKPRLDADQLRVLVEKQNTEDPYMDLIPAEFFKRMVSGSLEKWDHRAHLRAGFYVLVEHLKAGQGLWDAVEDFLGKLEDMLLNDSKKAEVEKREKRFRNTVHRTMTTFYLHSIHTAILAFMDSENTNKIPRYNQFNTFLLQNTHLMDPDLWSTYYSKYLMFSPISKSSWRLSDLKPLPDYIRLQRATNSRNIESKDGEQASDPPLAEKDHLQRFAFAVLKRVKFTAKRRGGVVKEALGALQKHTMGLRANGVDVEPYSETKAYFWIQILHAAVESLGGGAGASGINITRLSFESFVLLFPDLMRQRDKGKEVWRAHYTEKSWGSLEARMGVVLPGLKPLPNIIAPPTEKERNEAVIREIEIRELVQSGAERNTSEMEMMLHELWVISEVQETSTSEPPSSHAKALSLIFSKIWKAKVEGSKSIGVASNELVGEDLRGRGDIPFGVTGKVFWIRIILGRFIRFEVTPPANESVNGHREPSKGTSYRDFRRFLGENRELSLEDLWKQYYSEEIWLSEDAKERFVLPDLKEIENFVSPAAHVSSHQDASLEDYVVV